MNERVVSEDLVARLDLKFIENNSFVRYLFIKDSDGVYLPLSGYTASAPVRATRDGAVLGDIADGIVDRQAPDGTTRKAVRLLISPMESLAWDRFFWQLDLTDNGGNKRTRVAGQLFAKDAQQ